MNYKKISFSILLLGLMATVLIALPGCKDKKNDKAEQTLAEKMVGKWNFEGGYEKQNGEWVCISDADDEAWYDFKPDGTIDAYRHSGEVERSMLMKWSVDKETGDLRIFRESGEPVPIKAVFESDDQFYFYYTTGVEPSTGETREGEFKEVLVRDKK